MALSQKAMDFLEARGLDVELAARLGINSKRSSGGEVLAIPYYVGGQAVNHKYRLLDEKAFRQDKDGTSCFWNFDCLTDPSLDGHPLIITEGEFDALAVLQCGYPRVVSVPTGAPSHEIDPTAASTKYDYLTHAKKLLKDVKEIIICTDGDRAGTVLFNDLAVRLGKARCKFVQYPSDCKDFNEVLLKAGDSGVHSTLIHAKWCEIPDLHQIDTLPPYAEREGLSTGMDWLDEHFRIRMGDFTVVTGIPGDGKTTFVNDLICRIVDKYGWKAVFASFEQHPQSDHIPALREWKFGGPRQLMSESERRHVDAWIKDHFLFMVPGEESLPDLTWVLDMTASAAVRHGAKLVVIDPWNEIDHCRGRDETVTEYVGRAIKEFKRVAREFDIHVIVVAHPAKYSGTVPPSLYNISDSAHWANKADAGIVVWKADKGAPFADIMVVKSRYHDKIGRPGTVETRYNPVTRRFEHSPRPKPADDV